MKTLFISRNSPFDSIGGIERYISNLISFYKISPNLELCLMLPTKNADHIKRNENITIYFTKSLFLKRNKSLSKTEINHKAQEFSELVSKVIKQEEVDIICAENFHTDLPAAFSLLLTIETTKNDIPLVLQLHSFGTTQLQTELVNQLKWDKVSCVSRSVAGDCFQKGTGIEYLSTHYLGVNQKLFNLRNKIKYDLRKELILSKEDKIILTATRIIRGQKNILHEKGIINLIEAFSKLSPRYPKLKLLIAIGKPPESLSEEFNLALEMLKGYIKLHNIENQTILEMFSLDQMPDVYRASDIFVLASKNETFGQVFIEAMASGLPVIGAKVGGVPEIISDSYNGYLIPPNDSSILAQKIEILMFDSEIRKKFRSAGIKTAQRKFSSVKQLSNFHDDLQKLINSSSE